MSRSNSWLANLQPTYGVLVVVPGKAHVKRLIDGEMAVCLSRKEALKLAWEILGILKVHFGVGDRYETQFDPPVIVFRNRRP